MSATEHSMREKLRLPEVGHSMSVEEAQEYIAANVGMGVPCPCCGQLAKLYKRKFNTGMARGLIWLVRSDEPDWTDVPRTAPLWLIKIAGEFAKAAHWKLIGQKKNDDPTKRCSGLWRATAKGKNFAHGLEVIPTHVYLFDNKVVGFEGEETTIQRALGNRFNYEELMRGIHPSELSRVTQSRP